MSLLMCRKRRKAAVRGADKGYVHQFMWKSVKEAA